MTMSLSANELKTIIKESVQEMLAGELQSTRDEILAAKSEISKKCDTLVQKLENRVFTLEQENDKLKTELKDSKDRYEILKADNEVTMKIAQSALRQANHNAQYSRKDSIRISGLPIERGEDCQARAIKVIKDKLNVTIEETEIEVSHRVGKREGDKQDILVKFKHRESKNKVVSVRKKLKNTGVTVKEDLTQENMKLLNRLDQDKDIENCWAYNGKVWAIGKEQGD